MASARCRHAQVAGWLQVSCERLKSIERTSLIGRPSIVLRRVCLAYRYKAGMKSDDEENPELTDFRRNRLTGAWPASY